jgi:hypothetical protein
VTRREETPDDQSEDSGDEQTPPTGQEVDAHDVPADQEAHEPDIGDAG